MRDPIKAKENNQRRRCVYVKSRECDTAVENMDTRVEILRKKKTTTVHTSKNMDTFLKNVTVRGSIDKNSRTITIWITFRLDLSPTNSTTLHTYTKQYYNLDMN